MKITSYSNKNSINIQDSVNSFSLQCREFCSIVHSLRHVLDMVAVLDLSIITASKDNPSQPAFGVKDLTQLLESLSKIQKDADLNLSMLKSTKTYLDSALQEGRQLLVTNTGALTTILPKVRINAAELPGFLSEAEEIENVSKPQAEAALKGIKDTIKICWESLSKMNSILDQFPIDRTKDPYKHLPENESEL